jgi:aarF domain-containing kinase
MNYNLYFIILTLIHSPHPGNILLLGMDNGEPQLGLIDYGQVKKLSKEDRLVLCELIVALANEDKPEIVRLVKKAGYKSKYMEDELIYKYAKVSFGKYLFLSQVSFTIVLCE